MNDYKTNAFLIIVIIFKANKVYSVRPKMKSIMNDIYKNGPVVATMQVYEDFLLYKDGNYSVVFETYVRIYLIC